MNLFIKDDSKEYTTKTNIGGIVPRRPRTSTTCLLT